MSENAAPTTDRRPSEVHIFANHRLASPEEAGVCPECGSDQVRLLPGPDGAPAGALRCDSCGATVRYEPIPNGPQGQRFAYPWETEIVWLEDIARLDYVRVGYWGGWDERMQRPAYTGPGRLVGYALLDERTPARMPTGRRIFWLKDYDRDREPNGIYATGVPLEAVDPRTVQLGCRGRRTPRALGECSGPAQPED